MHLWKCVGSTSIANSVYTSLLEPQFLLGSLSVGRMKYWSQSFRGVHFPLSLLLNWCTICCCVGDLFIFTWQALLFLQFSQTVRIWLKLLFADFGSVLEKAHRQRLLFTLFKWGRVPISYEKKIHSFSFFSFLGTIPANYVAWPTGTETKSVTKTHADTEFQRTF